MFCVSEFAQKIVFKIKVSSIKHQIIFHFKNLDSARCPALMTTTLSLEEVTLQVSIIPLQ